MLWCLFFGGDPHYPWSTAHRLMFFTLSKAYKYLGGGGGEKTKQKPYILITVCAVPAAHSEVSLNIFLVLKQHVSVHVSEVTPIQQSFYFYDRLFAILFWFMHSSTVQYVEVVMQITVYLHWDNQQKLQALLESSSSIQQGTCTLWCYGIIYCAALLGTLVHLIIHANIQSAQHTGTTTSTPMHFCNRGMQ